jgi:hypothetical protein
MRFSTWLWEQLEEFTASAEFAKIAWTDVNNGCAHATFSVSDWVAHFDEKHKDRKDLLMAMMLTTYKEYMLSLGIK